LITVLELLASSLFLDSIQLAKGLLFRLPWTLTQTHLSSPASVIKLAARVPVDALSRRWLPLTHGRQHRLSIRTRRSSSACCSIARRALMHHTTREDADHQLVMMQSLYQLIAAHYW